VVLGLIGILLELSTVVAVVAVRLAQVMLVVQAVVALVARGLAQFKAQRLGAHLQTLAAAVEVVQAHRAVQVVLVVLVLSLFDMQIHLQTLQPLAVD
jgi:hypothetical protein